MATEDTMQRLKAKIEQESGLTAERKAELLRLLSTLDSEIDKLSQVDPEHAESIAGFIERSTHEATRKKKHQGLLKLSLEGLSESVKGFEQSHPTLTLNINNICASLASMGI
jgi:hypothetical protein